MSERITNRINHTQRVEYPEYLDERYGFLLKNGYYNYQEYINHLADKAQAGDDEALEACLYYFGWRGEGAPIQLLGYYYSQLTSGGIDITRTDSMAFIRLFSKEHEREILKGGHASYSKGKLARKKMQEISNRLLQEKTKADILHDLTDLLMDRIIQYKQGDRTLRKYIYDMFYLYVADYIQRTFRSKDFMEIPYAREDIDLEEVLEDESVSFDIPYESEDTLYEWEKSNGTLGLFWTRGHCHPVFDELTPSERAILRDNYHLKIPERQMAREYSVSRKLIKTRKKSAIKKIKDAFDRKDMDVLERLGYEPLTIPKENKK